MPVGMVDNYGFSSLLFVLERWACIEMKLCVMYNEEIPSK